MLELPDATQKLSSNSAKRARLRSLQLRERCNPPGQALAWTAARPAPELRQALATYTDQGNKLFVPFYQGLLAEIEAQCDAAGALAGIDDALALAGETEERWSDAFLHRCRGQIL